MARWFRNLAVNALLVAASTILAYVAGGFLLFRVVLGTADLTARPYLPETAGVLVQSTKAAYLPHNYLAILGDSYGQGLGDEAVKAGYDEGRWLQAANVVHELTGRDIVTFAKAGAGSAEALVLLPSRALNGSRSCAIFPTLEDPAQVFAYFYEGNDIEDNLRFLTRVRAKYGRSDVSDIDAYLSDEFASYPWWRCQAQLGDVASRLARFAYAEYTGELNVPSELPWRPDRLRVGEQIIAVPPLEGPAIGVGGEDLEAAIAVLDRSLLWLRERLPHAAITIVYIPSPRALYHHAGPDVEYGSGMRAEQILPRSRQLCGLVRAASMRARVGFLDTGPALREAASIQPIHGPTDWHHFNATGYRILGTALALRLPEPAKVDDCGSAGSSYPGAT
jgi:hypothetical protein